MHYGIAYCTYVRSAAAYTFTDLDGCTAPRMYDMRPVTMREAVSPACRIRRVLMIAVSFTVHLSSKIISKRFTSFGSDKPIADGRAS